MSKYTVIATQKIECEIEAETPMEALNAVNKLYKEGTLFDDKDYIEAHISIYEE